MDSPDPELGQVDDAKSAAQCAVANGSRGRSPCRMAKKLKARAFQLNL